MTSDVQTALSCRRGATNEQCGRSLPGDMAEVWQREDGAPGSGFGELAFEAGVEVCGEGGAAAA